MAPILQTKNLSVNFTQYTKGLHQRKIRSVKDISLDVQAGEVLAIIGASGSGKSLFANTILGILPGNAEVSGDIHFKGEPLDKKRIEKLRGNEIALVPQTIDALDPLIKVGKQVQLTVKNGDPVEKQREVFKKYRLEPEVTDMYPHELSGGMARRVLVSMAFLTDADLIIADEPTPGMDAESVEETLKQIVNLQNKNNAAIIMIIHDIKTALKVAERLAIFLEGRIAEIANVGAFQGDGQSLSTKYAKDLWLALPENGFHKPLRSIKGEEGLL